PPARLLLRPARRPPPNTLAPGRTQPRKKSVCAAPPPASAPAAKAPAAAPEAKAGRFAGGKADAGKAEKEANIANGAKLRLDEGNRVMVHKKPKRAAIRVDDDFVGQINGWAPVRVFPVPQYTRAYDGPRTDFRETVYWNPVVETSASGDADVSFVTSDAVTSFRATVEGFSATGVAGGGQIAFQSKLPLTLDAHLPVEVTSGDTVRL